MFRSRRELSTFYWHYSMNIGNKWSCLLFLITFLPLSTSYAFVNTPFSPLQDNETFVSCIQHENLDIEFYFMVTRDCLMAVSTEPLDAGMIAAHDNKVFAQKCDTNNLRFYRQGPDRFIIVLTTDQGWKRFFPLKLDRIYDGEPSFANLLTLQVHKYIEVADSRADCASNLVDHMSCFSPCTNETNCIFVENLLYNGLNYTTGRANENIIFPSHFNYNPLIMRPTYGSKLASRRYLWLESSLHWFYQLNVDDYRDNKRLYLTTFTPVSLSDYFTYDEYSVSHVDYQSITVQYCNWKECVHVYHQVQQSSELKPHCLYRHKRSAINIIAGVLTRGVLEEETLGRNRPQALTSGQDLFRVVFTDGRHSFYPLLILLFVTTLYLVCFAYMTIQINSLNSIIPLHLAMENEIAWVGGVLKRLLEDPNQPKPPAPPKSDD